MKMMIKTVVAGIVVAGTMLAGRGLCDGEEQATPEPEATAVKQQTTCPIMGGKINKDLYVDHDGKRIYICCPGCSGPIQKDPGKYIKKLESEGVTLAKVQTTCPVMVGRKVNRNIYVDHGGKRIYLCCRSCGRTVKKDPEKYIKKLESEGIVLDAAKEE